MRLSAAALLAAPALLGACDFQVPLDLPRHTPRLVVNGTFVSGEPWNVYVSRSAPLGDSVGPTGVPDATVEVYAGTALVERLTLFTRGDGQAWYRGRAAPPRPGVAYTVRVSTPALGTAEATDTAPPPVTPVVRSVERLPASGQGERYTVALALDDPPGPSFYRLRFEQDSDEAQPPLRARFCSADPVFRTSLVDLDPGEAGMACFYDGAVFSGETFDGAVRTLTVRLDGVHFPTGSVVLERLSADSYAFERSARQADRAADNPFVEPADLFGNVRGGLGLFGGRTAAVQPLAFPR